MFGCVEIDNSTNVVGEKCSDGLYLYTNTTLSDSPEVITACVLDGSLVDPRLINNPETRQGESGGDACLAGGSDHGGESGEGSEDSSSITEFLPLNPIGLSTDFATCTRCYSQNSACETGSVISDEVVCTDCIQTVDTSSGPSCSQNFNGDAYGNGTCQDGASGFFLQSDNSGLECSNFENGGRGNNTNCLECNKGYSTLSNSSEGTLKCYSESYFQGDCVEGQDTTSDSKFDSCSRCNKDLIYQPYSTNVSMIGCVTSCNKNQYVSYELVSDQYGSIYDKRTGVNGNISNCYECVGSNENQGKSCMQGYYLNLNQVNGVLGTCIAMNNSTLVLNLFITPNNEEENADGSYELPYGNIAKALQAAEELSAEYADAKVTIFLLNGDHYLTRNVDHYHYTSREIIVQPVFGSNTYDNHFFEENDSDGAMEGVKLIVYYQMGNDFRFEISKSLTIKNIIFDALDSSFDPSLKCLQYKSKCCEWSEEILIPFETNPEPLSECKVYSYQSENGLSTIGGSLFQFQYLEDNDSNDTIGTLTLDSGVFQNFFYDFTSIIGLIYNNGKINIFDSVFDKFSSGGSIIRSTLKMSQSIQLNSTSANLRIRLRDMLVTDSSLKHSYYQAMNSPCTSSEGSSISIKSSNFSNFNYLKPNMTNIFKIGEDSDMRYQGLIINVKDFYGDTLIKDCIFDSLQFKFGSGSIIYEPIFDLNEYVWTQTDVIQGKTLFYINGESNVEFIQNTFSKCNSAIGLIYVVKNSDNYGVLIHNNTFESSSALLGANNIRLDILRSKEHNETLGNNMPGAGVQISNNYFHHNIGGLHTLGNILSLGGSASDFDNIINNDRSFSEPALFPMNKTNVTILNGISSFSTISMITLNEGSNEIDLNLFVSKDNLYLENFLPNLKGMTSFYNIYKIKIDGDTYKDNGFMYKEALNKYGTIYSNEFDTEVSGAFTFSGYFLQNSGVDKSDRIISQIYFSGPPVYIQCSLNIDILNAAFDNNYLVEQFIDYDKLNTFKTAQIISIAYSKGNINIKNTSYQNYNGIDLSKVGTILNEEELSRIHWCYDNEIQLGPGDFIAMCTYNYSYFHGNVNDPDYFIKYPTNAIAIHTYKSNSESETDYSNYFDKFTVSNFTVFNISTDLNTDNRGGYQIISLGTTIKEVVLDGINYSNSSGLGGDSVFHVSNTGNFTLTNVNAKYFNADPK